LMGRNGKCIGGRLFSIVGKTQCNSIRDGYMDLQNGIER